MAKVSVIIPVYNAEKYLSHCLNFVVEQTLPDIEIICVDNGSTDSSFSILQEYAAKDCRFILLQQQNKDTGVARNKGLQQAKGTYVIFLDTDHFFEQNLLELAYQAGIKDTADVILFEVDRFDNYTKKFSEAKWLLKADLIPAKRTFSAKDIPDRIFNIVTPCLETKMFRRSFVLNENLLFQDTRNFFDVRFVMTALAIAERITFVSEPLVHYRVDVGCRHQVKINKDLFNFYITYAALKEELVKRNCFHLFEQSFVNLALSSCLYSLRASDNNYTKELLLYRMPSLFQKLGISGHEDEYFYSASDREEFLKIIRLMEKKVSCPSNKIAETLVTSKGNDRPDVSIIIPVYNKEKYLKECLDSVLQQKGCHIEVIAINDGSTDNSLKILQSYQSNDPRIKIINQSNQGAGKSRNQGILAAAGEFVAFMDPDDFYPENDILLHLYVSAKWNEVKISGGSFSSLRNGKIITEYYGLQRKYMFEKDQVMLYSDYQFDYGHQRFIYNLDMLRRNNIYYPDYQRFQDPPFLVRAMIYAKRFYATNRIVYCYREGYQNVNWTPRKSTDLLKGLIDNLQISRENNLAELHYITFTRLNSSSYCNIFLTNIYTYDSEFFYLLVKANSMVDYGMLQNFDTSIAKGEIILPLERLAISPGCLSIIKRNQAQNDECQIGPKVSVIIPIYNVEAYLQECIDSARNQTLRDIEIICVNDGSKDSSLEIAEANAAIDDRIIVIDKKNGGLSSARNAGVREAHGKYVCFLDSDDLLDEDAIFELYHHAEKYRLDVLYFDADSFFESKELKKNMNSYLEYYHRKGKYNNVFKGTELFCKFEKNNEYRPSACLQFINRAFYLEHNFSFYEGIIHEDHLFSLVCILEATRAMHKKKSYYKRRVREGSIMTVDEGPHNLYGFIITYSEIMLYLSKHKYDSETVIQIRSELNLYVRLINIINSKISNNERQVIFSTLTMYQQQMFDFALIQKRNKANLEQSKQLNLNKLNNELNAVYNSWSFKIGRLITFIPRKIRGGVRCHQEHGLKYTLRRIKEHLTLQ